MNGLSLGEKIQLFAIEMLSYSHPKILLMNIVTINLYMFHTVMKDEVGGNLDNTSIVIV